jgi:hypothetical protein
VDGAQKKGEGEAEGMKFLIELNEAELCHAACSGLLARLAGEMTELGGSFAAAAGSAAGEQAERERLREAVARFATTPERDAAARAAIAAHGGARIADIAPGCLAGLAESLRALGVEA